MTNTLLKDYRLIRELGRGGMAVVYLAEHELLHVHFAVKVLNEDLARNENIRKRFLKEAREMARMKHPGVIKVSDLIEDGNTVAFVMEYIEGETLKDYLDRKGKLSDKEIKDVFLMMLKSVAYVHEQNLVHRDIKPSNFMIDTQGKVKLMDFGISKTMNTTSADYTITEKGMMMGTPMYMSPEQVKEARDVTLQSDIYSLGVVLWQIVTGKRPYDTDTLSDFALKYQIVHEPLPETGTHWDEDIRKATVKDATGRWKNCEEWKGRFVQSNTENNRISKGSGDDATIITASNSAVEIRIGNQVWMTQNLDSEKFLNGDFIPEASSQEEWMAAVKNQTPVWCWPKNGNNIQKIYGKLYNWYAVTDPRGICPSGWHVPTDQEWTDLENFLGGDHVAGGNMKTTGTIEDNTGNWHRPNYAATNSSGFACLPGGFRATDGSNNWIGRNCYLWSASQCLPELAWGRFLDSGSGALLRCYSLKTNGFFVRCLRD